MGRITPGSTRDRYRPSLVHLACADDASRHEQVKEFVADLKMIANLLEHLPHH
jgi:hypothetical protein